jgi:MIP family channel proteins
LALACRRGFPWAKVVPYSLAQIAGAFTASAIVYAVYHESLYHFDQGVRQVGGERDTAGIFATYPQDFLSNFPGGFVDQVVGTALLVGGIFAITDRRNNAPDPRLAPVIVGALVMLIGMTFGHNCGYAINPARDFGPRLFTALAGWGTKVWDANNNWWWVPIAGPCVGGVLGGVIYDLFISRHHTQEATAV